MKFAWPQLAPLALPKGAVERARQSARGYMLRLNGPTAGVIQASFKCRCVGHGCAVAATNCRFSRFAARVAHARTITAAERGFSRCNRFLHDIVCVGVVLVHLIFVFNGFGVAVDDLVGDFLAAGVRLGLTAH
jgi:hypothetical protein